jgi:hypothetical protein
MTWGFWRHDWEIAQLIPSGLLVMGRDGTTCGHQSRISNMLPIGVPRFDCLPYDLCTTETFTGNIKLIMLVGCTSIILHIPGMLLVWSGYRTLYRMLYSSSSSSDTHRNEQNIPVSWHVSWVSKLCVCLCVYVLVSACLSISISILYYCALSYLIYLSIFLFIYMSFSYAYVYIYNLYIYDLYLNIYYIHRYVSQLQVNLWNRRPPPKSPELPRWIDQAGPPFRSLTPGSGCFVEMIWDIDDV